MIPSLAQHLADYKPLSETATRRLIRAAQKALKTAMTLPRKSSPRRPLRRLSLSKPPKRVGVGGEDPLETLVARNIRVIVQTARRAHLKSNGGLTLDDLKQIALHAFVKAVRQFKLDRKNKFITYAVTAMRNDCQRALDEQGREIRISVNYEKLSRRYYATLARLAADTKYAGRVNDRALKRHSGLTARQIKAVRKLPSVAFSLDAPLRAADGEETDRHDLLPDLAAPDPAESILSAVALTPNQRAALNRWLRDHLPASQADVLRLHFGLHPDTWPDGLSLYQIARRQRQKTAKVQALKKNALATLRRPNHRAALARLLGLSEDQPPESMGEPVEPVERP